MSLPKYNNFFQSVFEIDEEILSLEKNLLHLRLERNKKNAFLPHLVRKKKRQLAQLRFQKSERKAATRTIAIKCAKLSKK